MGWVDQEEAAGYVFRDPSGTRQDPFVLLKAKNVNSIRLRVWVNATGGWNNGADVLNEARRAIAQGQRATIDFHYSDTWADPAHQTKPAAGASHTVAQLQADVYAHTKGILDYLKADGVTVTWVQVGNEINSGMLWREGKVSGTTNWAALASYFNNGYNATKASFPSAQLIVHLANGYDDADFRWFFDALKAAGGKRDVIGMSHYPAVSGWQTTNNQIYATMQDMVSRYGKPVIERGAAVPEGVVGSVVGTADSPRPRMAGSRSTVAGEGTSHFLLTDLASTGHRGRVDAGGRHSGSAPCLTRTSGLPAR